jgi:hypothetical protein
MHKIIFMLIGIVLIACNSGRDSQSSADTVAVSEPDSTLPGGNINNDKYICGFTGSFAYADNSPLAAALSSANDSVIERTFADIWTNVVGGSPDAIRIEKDAEQNNTEYKYAAAKGSFTDLGNIVRHIFYKSNDLSPLLHRDNGWHLTAIALHEFAHHINGDPFTGASRDVAELRADDYAGLIMGRDLKTTLDTALLAFSNLTEEHPNNGYPDRQRRIAAVRAGWERGQIPPRHSLVSAFIAVMGTRHGVFLNDSDLDFGDIQNAIHKNGNLEILKDTSTIEMAKVHIEASSSPGEFFLDSNYLYFKKTDSMSIVGTVAYSNRPEYRQMVYDNFYNYIYIDDKNSLITYVEDFRDPRRSLKPIVIGILSK